MKGDAPAGDSQVLRCVHRRTETQRIGRFGDEELGHVTRIDIRVTSVIDLEPLSTIGTLDTLIVEPGQFTDEQLSELPKRIAVIERSLAGGA